MSTDILAHYADAMSDIGKYKVVRNLQIGVGLFTAALGAYVHVFPWAAFICGGFATFNHLYTLPKIEKHAAMLRVALIADK